MILTRPASRDDLVEHLTADHGYSPAVAESLSLMGAALAHVDAHRANPGHDHASG